MPTFTPQRWPTRWPTGQPGSSPPAEAGKRYAFPVGGATEYVRFPDRLPAVAPLPLMSPVVGRVREPWTVSFEKDLGPVAEWVDDRLAGRLEITNRNWRKRLDDLRFSLVDPSGGLADRPAEFTIDGVEHIVGLMNSGKTTLTDLITIDGARNRGKRVLQVVGSVGDVYAKVSFLRAAGHRRGPADRAQLPRRARRPLLAHHGRGISGPRP